MVSVMSWAHSTNVYAQAVTQAITVKLLHVTRTLVSTEVTVSILPMDTSASVKTASSVPFVKSRPAQLIHAKIIGNTVLDAGSIKRPKAGLEAKKKSFSKFFNTITFDY